MGGTYEEWVVAWYLLHLLRGGPVAGLGTLARVVTQTRAEGWLLDDICLHLEQGGRKRRVAIECKGGRFLTAAGVPDRETADRAWRLLAGSTSPPFEEGHDRMFLVVREWSGDASRAWRSLEKAAAGGAAGAVRRAAQGVMKEKLLAGLRPPDDLALSGDAGDPVRLLSHLRVVHLELGDEGDKDDDEAVRQCQELVESAADARKLWDALGRLARRRQHAFELDLASLVAELRPDHALRVLPDHRRVVSDLDRWRGEDFPTLPAHIRGVHVSRTDVIERLRAATSDHALVALTGASGVGKTGIVRDLTPASLGVDTVLAMRAARLTADNVAQIVQTLSAHPARRGVLVIDAVDRNAEGDGTDRVATLIRGVAGLPIPWTVVVVCAEAAWPQVLSRISRLANALARPPIVEVGAFSPDEVDQVLSPLKARLGPSTRERLRPVLSNPWSLNRVVDVVESGADLPPDGTVGPAMLGRLWWSRALDEGDPAGSARAQAVLLAPSMADAGGATRPRPAELRELTPLVTTNVLERRNDMVQFSHARFEEVALARHLVGLDVAERAREWRRRTTSLRWRAALILAAAEVAETEPLEWARLAEQLDRRVPADDDLLVVLLEALLHTGDAERALQSVATSLLDSSGGLLHRLATHLHDKLGAARMPEGWERAGWRALVSWATAQAPSLRGTCLRALYPIVEGAGFYARVLDLPRSDLKALADLVVCQVDEVLNHRGDGILEDRALFAAFVVVLDLDFERARPLVRVLCGRERRPEPPTATSSGRTGLKLPASILAMSGPREDAPAEPWPEGPVEEPIRAFREVALSVHGMVGLYNADPVLAIEVLLALLIEEPESREPWWMDLYEPVFVLPGFAWAAKVDNGFFVPVEVLGRDWGMLLAFVIRASTFAARALEVYRTETRGPVEEPIRLDLVDGPREYPGGGKLWSIGRGVDQPTEVLGYSLKRLAEAIRSAELQPTDRALVVRLLLRCASTAALGFLCRLIAEAPDTITGEAAVVLQDPRLSAWECERSPTEYPGSLVVAARDAWFRTGWAWAPIESARAHWAASLDEGRCPEHLRGWTRNLITLFDRARWKEERLSDGRVSWVWLPDAEQQERNQEVAAQSGPLFRGLQVWHAATRLVRAGARVPPREARTMLDAARGLAETDLHVNDARIAVVLALTLLAPEVLDDGDAFSTAVGWLEPAFDTGDHESGSGVVVGRIDATAAAAQLWARDPASPASKRIAGLAVTCNDERVVRTFFSFAAKHRQRHVGEFRRLLQAGFAYRAERGGDNDAPVRFAAVAALIADTRSAPTGPIVPTGHLHWLAPMTRWVRDVPRDAEVDAIIDGIDVSLRAELARLLESARVLDGTLRKGRVTTPRSLDHPPTQYQMELLRTLARWLLEVPRARADMVIRPWLDATAIPPEWLAWLIDALYQEALAQPDAHGATSAFLVDVVGRVLDDPAWHATDGTLLHELEDRTLGVGYSGFGAEDWGVEAAPLLRDLRDLRLRWVERVRGSDGGVLWVTALGRTPAADGTRSEFAGLLVQFSPEARRRDPHVQHVAAFLQLLVTDPSFRSADPSAEALLADVRAAGLPAAHRIEEAMRSAHAKGVRP